MTPKRQCGECTLCCKLVPVQELDKQANTRCQHQRFKKGCAIYGKRPHSCKTWTCRWLTNQDTYDLPRPDRAHYVIDVIPDYVTVSDNKDQTPIKIPAIQLWVDPKHPDAYQNPMLRHYLLRQAEAGNVAVIRFNCHDAITLIPPTMMKNGQWHEVKGESEAEHSTEQLINALGNNFLDIIS